LLIIFQAGNRLEYPLGGEFFRGAKWSEPKDKFLSAVKSKIRTCSASPLSASKTAEKQVQRDIERAMRQPKKGNASGKI
jgi:hypothetical protein